MLVTALFILLSSSVISGLPSLVPTPLGSVQGRVDPASQVSQFLGLRYAAPAQRWTAPKPALPWQGIYNATTTVRFIYRYLKNAIYSEDCLYMNLYIPPSAHAVTNATEGLGVVLWVYGGNYVSGSADLYDGTQLAAQGNVIVASINYRVGPFGFLALDELNAEDPNGAGNYGIADQRQALHWLKEYIAYFGGNPNDITFAGESAGAISACIHITSPPSAGLFSSAVMMSGFCSVISWNDSTALGAQLTQALNCNGTNATETLSCLRQANASLILKAGSTIRWWPSTNQVDILAQPSLTLQTGNYANLSLLIGTDVNEMAYFFCSSLANLTADEYAEKVKMQFSDYAQQVLEMYPASKYPTPLDALIDAWSDKEFKCPARSIANTLADKGSRVYMYSFETVPGYIQQQDPCVGAGHSVELPFVFPNYLLQLLNYTFSTQEKTLSDWMIGAWSQWAASQTVPELWTRYASSQAPYLVLNASQALVMAPNFRSAQCDFWDEYSNEHHNDKIDGPAADAARATAGFIVLGIIGGVAFIAIIAIIIRYFYNQRQIAENFERL